MRRAHILFLAVLALGLVVRGEPHMAGGDSAERPAVEQAVDSIDMVLGSANPHLAPSERRRIARAVIRSSERHSLDPQLVTAIILVESSARPWALSKSGAVGLMQVMPHMAALLDLGGNLTTIENNIEAGCWILADNIRRLGEDDGISAYFWGSDIRGVAYLDRVRAARATVQRLARS
ncbi:MAG: transglycosylase SLT domain-containing protein [Myxococcota bacterium]